MTIMKDFALPDGAFLWCPLLQVSHYCKASQALPTTGATLLQVFWLVADGIFDGRWHGSKRSLLQVLLYCRPF